MIQFICSFNDKSFIICIVLQVFRQAVRVGVKEIGHRLVFRHSLYRLQLHCHTLKSGL